MADEATERFLENATRIIWIFITFSSVYIVFTETIEINGSIVRFVPVGFEDFPEVFGWALILILIAFVTAQLDVASFEESIFTKVCRRCSIVSFALAVCLLFICRLLSSAALIGSVLAYEEL